LVGVLRGLASQADSEVAVRVGQIFLGEGSLTRSVLWSLVVVLSYMVVLGVFCRRRVRPRPLASLLGGLLFLALWSAAGWAFDLYVGRFAALPATYGPWAAWIVIQLWIYYSTVVFMLASEFVKTVERNLARA